MCDYDYIALQTDNCAVSLNGNCDIDVDECASGMCVNGATCEDSTDVLSIMPHLYLCTCVDGYTNTEGNQDCGVDIDECASSPCQNGATCSQEGDTSTFEVDLYSCACPAGFANGMCSNYDYITEYNALCNVCLLYTSPSPRDS